MFRPQRVTKDPTWRGTETQTEKQTNINYTIRTQKAKNRKRMQIEMGVKAENRIAEERERKKSSLKKPT